MPRIQRLSQSVINKIAAGEVIERPASVLKELVENSVDAGATRIDVSVEAGGIELVRVADTGCGISPDDLPLAIASHATSKIVQADDLFHVSTLGFRGEAVASIAEVSRFTIRSRTADSESGSEMEVVGGQASPVTPCGCPVGTSVEVRNLFFNTPVRKKYLRSIQTELGHLSEAFIRIALAWPQVHFTLRHNDRVTYDLPGSGQLLERIAAIFGRPLTESLIWVESAEGPVRLSGYVAMPSQSRSNNHMQYLFLNGRAIRDRSLQHALGEAYRGLLMVGRFPVAILYLEMPPDLVDVNVHPTKYEVRFQDSSRLYSQLLATLRTKFLNTDLTTRVQTPVESDPSGAMDEQQAAQLRQKTVDWAKGGTTAPTPPATAEPPKAQRDWTAVLPSVDDDPDGFRPSVPAATAALAANSQTPPFRPFSSEDSPLTPRPAVPAPPTAPSAPFAPPPASVSRSQALPADHPVRALQVHNRYLVAESDDGVMVIDQHALHERILYEQLRERILAGSIESQHLLVPEAVDLSPAEAAAAMEQRELLAQLGMKIEPFGGGTVLLTSYPAMLANINPVEVLHEVIGQILGGGKLPDRRDLLDSLLHTIACKAAIKAGDRLAPEEVETLVRQRHLIEDAHHCPHGRPTALIFSREELDKQFRRV